MQRIAGVPDRCMNSACGSLTCPFAASWQLANSCHIHHCSTAGWPASERPTGNLTCRAASAWLLACSATTATAGSLTCGAPKPWQLAYAGAATCLTSKRTRRGCQGTPLPATAGCCRHDRDSTWLASPVELLQPGGWSAGGPPAPGGCGWLRAPQLRGPRTLACWWPA